MIESSEATQVPQRKSWSSRGYVSRVEGQMQKDSSVKYKCDGCALWFDEVKEAYMFTAALLEVSGWHSAGARG